MHQPSTQIYLCEGPILEGSSGPFLLLEIKKILLKWSSLERDSLIANLSIVIQMGKLSDHSILPFSSYMIKFNVSLTFLCKLHLIEKINRNTKEIPENC